MSFFPGHFASRNCLQNYFRNNFVSEGRYLGDQSHVPNKQKLAFSNLYPLVEETSPKGGPTSGGGVQILGNRSTELGERFLPLTKFWGGELSEFLSAYHLCVCFFAEVTEFDAELSSCSPSKEPSRNGTLPVSQIRVCSLIFRSLVFRFSWSFPTKEIAWFFECFQLFSRVY